MSQSSNIAVIKVGGDILLDKSQYDGLANNIKNLTESGWQVVVLHGGGPQVNRLQAALNIQPNKIEGRRITNEQDLRVVKQAIAGEVNVDLVSHLMAVGVNAFGCHGASGGLIQAVKRPPMQLDSCDKPVDFGEVGDVTVINHQLLQQLLAINLVPVIATLGISEQGQIFNINADTTVVKIAEALNADMLLLVTAIGGIYKDISQPESRIPMLNEAKANLLINTGIIRDGMIPKVKEAFRSLHNGIGRIVILSPQQHNAFCDAANNSQQHGTVLTL